MMEMDYIQERKINYPCVRINNSQFLHINKPCIEKFGLREFGYIMVGYNRAENAVIIRFEKDNLDEAYYNKLSFRSRYGKSVYIRNLLKANGLDFDEVKGRYFGDALTFEDGQLVIYLGEKKGSIRSYHWTNKIEKMSESPKYDLPTTDLDKLEKQAILSALEKSKGCQKDAAKLLGISPRALSYKIIYKYNIKQERYR